jgi:ATP-dependent helicase HrpB
MRPAFDPPEIVREDLAEAVLLTAAAGATGLEWLDPPPEAALDAARSLLSKLGAIDGTGRATALGREMTRFPLHPRLARLVLEAHARGASREGALAAALISERDIRGTGRGADRAGHAPTGPSDLLEMIHLFTEAERVRFAPDRLRSLGLDPLPVAHVENARRQIAALLPPEAAVRREGGKSAVDRPGQDQALLDATLAAFSDRIGRRREPRGVEIVLAGGGSARMSPGSVVRDAPLLAALDVEDRRTAPGTSRALSGKGSPTVRLASAVTPEMLLEQFPDRLRWEDSVAWNEAGGRVEGWETMSFDGLVIESSRKQSVDPAAAASLLAAAARARGARTFAPEGAVDALNARLAFVSETFGEAGLSPFTEAAIDERLTESCRGRKSFDDLSKTNLAELLLSTLPGERRAFLDRMAPERITLRGGRTVKVHYEAGGGTPRIESRLQDFFGEVKGPAIGNGRVPLVIHLLAPNMRAVQVTSDLEGFWSRHYPAIRKELMRRYPRHDWPENPREASPPKRRG